MWLRFEICQNTFRGELVAQDLDDEPAEKLLARIKASRAAIQAKGGRGRRKPEQT